jgi:hypothetical protein
MLKVICIQSTNPILQVDVPGHTFALCKKSVDIAKRRYTLP